MTFFTTLPRARFFPFLCAFVLLLCLPHFALAEKYKIVYLLTSDKEQALDYRENIESVLGTDISRKLLVVSKGKKFGVIYDVSDSPISATRTLVEHGDLLEKAGFDQPFASQDNDFYPLYNVSYGLGPNIEDLKKVYDKVYGTLGVDVGRNLFIEETASGNYTLIYRRQGSKKTTNVVARRHARVLRSKKIKTSIAKENNNEIVFGESSLLDESETVLAKVETPKKLEVTPVEIKKIEQSPVVIHKKPTPFIVKTPPTPQPTRPVAPPVIVVAKPSVEPVQIEKSPTPVVKPSPVIHKVYLASNASQYKKVKTPQMRDIKSPSSKRFEKSVESYIAGLRSKGRLASDESTAWMVFDLATGKSVVDINANRPFQTASMIKPFVALAFFHKVKNGELKYGPKSRRNLAAMIQRSNNAATNWVMRQVGGPKSTERILKKYYPHIFKGLQLKEYIPVGGRTYKNKTYPSDYVRFLRQLWDKKLPYSNEMRRLMALPGRDRLYFGTPIPRGTLVYNKTGSTAHLCGDMGILVPKTRSGSRYPYVIVGVIERASRPDNYSSWVNSRSKVIREVSTLVYKQMKKEHKLL